MKELTGRLSALDSQASESLKVIEYFDVLVHGRVGIEGMLRGAAVLCGTTVGRTPDAAASGRRYARDGAALPSGTPSGWPFVVADDGSTVWLEREGDPHANDAMVLERLALAVSVTSLRLDAQAPARRALEVLLSADATDEQREDARNRLRLHEHDTVWVSAVPGDQRVRGASVSALVPTPFGIVRAVVAGAGEPVAARAGVASCARGADLREAWRAALVALRLTDEETPVVAAASLGALLPAALLADQQPAPDAVAIERLLAGPWSARMLRAVLSGASQRALAEAAGVHHSTMGARLHELPALLGYDPTTPLGRTRLGFALMLHTLRVTRFD